MLGISLNCLVGILIAEAMGKIRKFEICMSYCEDPKSEVTLFSFIDEVCQWGSPEIKTKDQLMKVIDAHVTDWWSQAEKLRDSLSSQDSSDASKDQT